MSAACFQSSPSSWRVARRKRDRWELRSHSNQCALMSPDVLLQTVCVCDVCVCLFVLKTEGASYLDGPRCAAESHCCSLESKNHSKGTSLHASPSALYPAQALYLFNTHTHTHIHAMKLHNCQQQITVNLMSHTAVINN